MFAILESEFCRLDREVNELRSIVERGGGFGARKFHGFGPCGPCGGIAGPCSGPCVMPPCPCIFGGPCKLMELKVCPCQAKKPCERKEEQPCVCPQCDTSPCACPSGSSAAASSFSSSSSSAATGTSETKEQVASGECPPLPCGFCCAKKEEHHRAIMKFVLTELWHLKCQVNPGFGGPFMAPSCACVFGGPCELMQLKACPCQAKKPCEGMEEKPCALPASNCPPRHCGFCRAEKEEHHRGVMKFVLTELWHLKCQVNELSHPCGGFGGSAALCPRTAGPCVMPPCPCVIGGPCKLMELKACPCQAKKPCESKEVHPCVCPECDTSPCTCPSASAAASVPAAAAAAKP